MDMEKSIIIIGAGMGGLAAGIYGQRNGFRTAIFEAHNQPGGQCTGWSRKGYVFDACIHDFPLDRPQSKMNGFLRELGILPCETVAMHECMSAVTPEGTYVHDYCDLEKLESHLIQLSPGDAAAIDEYIGGIRRFQADDSLSALMMGSFLEKLVSMPALLGLLKYFRHTLDTFAVRFKAPLLRKVFPLLHHSAPDVPLFLHLAKHAAAAERGKPWPKGGSLTVANNMAARYLQLGGTIHYRKKVVKILTDHDCACGVELEDGTRHTADFIVSNADGRKTILQMLSGKYTDGKILKYCETDPEKECAFSVMVFLGVKRDLSSYPSALLLFLEKPEVIGGHRCDHLYMQMYGFDASMAPAGKGVIKVELLTKPLYFSRLADDKLAYREEKNRIAGQVINLLEKSFPGLREDIEVIDVSTLHTWERFMGGTEGFNNFPNKPFNIIDEIFGLNPRDTLPGLKNFFFAGQWATSAGALHFNAFSGKTVVQKICRQCGMRFSK
jgi:phytoene dehydrogenase-like protein